MKKTDDIKEKILDFMAKNSVYIILGAVIVTVITITAVSLFTTPHDDVIDAYPSPSTTVGASISLPTKSPNATIKPTKSPNNSTIPSTPTPTPGISDIISGTTNPDDNNNDKDVSSDTVKTFSIVLPFSKKSVITSFSNEKPVYSQTLDEWACHVGLDFSCKARDEVKSAANGIVKSITEDGVYGKTVTVAHSDGFLTLYRGLDAINVNVDELISEGQVIGTAAEVLPYETHMGTHIHFELIKDGIKVNPLSFVK